MSDRSAPHPVHAWFYARAAAWMDRHGAADCRRRLLGGISGRVLEVGAGTGANLGHYPAAVTEVLAVEPQPRLRALAERAAREARVPVQVVAGVADRLPAGDGEFDAAVTSLVLCSVPDQPAALAELRRVLRPGGRLYFWEHVRAPTSGLARLQRAADATVWPWFAGGCHTARDTAAAIAAAGFTIDRLERFDLPDVRVPIPVKPQVLGTATRG